jgi:hypothetical protein
MLLDLGKVEAKEVGLDISDQLELYRVQFVIICTIFDHFSGVWNEPFRHIVVDGFLQDLCSLDEFADLHGSSR